MDLRAMPNLVHLSGRQSLQLEPARGYRVIAICGEVWITQAGRLEDYVLRAGDSLTLDSPGLAIVSAFGTADVEVVAPPAAPAVGGFPEYSVATLERAQREAHRLRAEAMREAFAEAGGWIRNFARRLVVAKAS
jgi:hypothetical protein